MSTNKKRNALLMNMKCRRHVTI